MLYDEGYHVVSYIVKNHGVIHGAGYHVVLYDAGYYVVSYVVKNHVVDIWCRVSCSAL